MSSLFSLFGALLSSIAYSLAVFRSLFKICFLREPLPDYFCQITTLIHYSVSSLVFFIVLIYHLSVHLFVPPFHDIHRGRDFSPALFTAISWVCRIVSNLH